MNISFYNVGPPKKPGRYFFKGKFGGDVQLYTIALRGQRYFGGMKFNEYLAVVECGYRNCEALQGEWSEEVIFK